MKQYKYKINGNLYNVTVNNVEENIAHVEVNGTPYEVELDEPIPAPVVTSAPSSAKAPVKASNEEIKVESAAVSSKTFGVKSPLPGVIKDIKVNVGDMVKRGQTILILEAMKMENNINADKDGKVVAIKVNKGDSVMEGTDLILIG
jgi:glutaconyl-CoA/methylmalonyl-CoA decarboxylase subunit gamma